MIQKILAIAILGVAVLYLGKQFYVRFFSKKTNCDSCAVSQIKVEKNSLTIQNLPLVCLVVA